MRQWTVAEFLIITGLSGAGRSQAGATLEDLGWFVIDNMPTALITKVAELVAAPGSTTDRVVLVVGRDAEQLGELEAAIDQLRAERLAGAHPVPGGVRRGPGPPLRGHPAPPPARRRKASPRPSPSSGTASSPSGSWPT